MHVRGDIFLDIFQDVATCDVAIDVTAIVMKLKFQLTKFAIGTSSNQG